MSNLANTYIRRQRHTEAKPLLEEAHTLAQEEGNLFTSVMTATNLSAVAQGLDDDEEAEVYARKALTVAREIGDQRWTATNLNAVSRIYLRRQQWRRAEQYARDALRMTPAIPSEIDLMSDLSCLAQIWIHEGEMERTLRILLFVEQHPSTVQYDKDRNRTLLDELRTESPPAQLAEVEARAHRASLEEALALVDETGPAVA